MEEPRRPWKVVAAFAVAAVVVLAAGWYAWDRYLRPRTIIEALGTNVRPGETVTVEGTIVSVRRVNTTYGPEVYLGIDGSPCSEFGDVRADPNGTYRVGDRVRFTVRMEPYAANGDPVVWAADLVCPFPALLRIFSWLSNAVSLVSGFALLAQGVDSEGWTRFEVVTLAGDGYDPAHLPVTLRRAEPYLDEDIKAAGVWSGAAWIVWSAVEYVRLTGGFASEPIVDEMARLSEGVSRNGTIAYDDGNGDGRVDDGDIVRLRLPPTANRTAYDTYLLQVGERMTAYAAAGHYLLNGPRGIYEEIPSDEDARLVHLRYLGHSQAGSTVTTALEVARYRLGSPRPFGGLRFGLTLIDPAQATQDFTGNLTEDPVQVGNGTFDFEDVDSDGLLDTGDRIVVSGFQNRSEAVVRIMQDNYTLASYTWSVGYGHVVGRFPWVVLEPPTSGPPYRVVADVPHWHPELALNRTLTVSLRENGVLVVANASVTAGRFAPFPGGNLTFDDADGDGVLTAGDSFAVEVATAARYELTISVLYGWQTNTVAFGP